MISLPLLPLAPVDTSVVALRQNTGQAGEITYLRGASGGAIFADVTSTVSADLPYPRKQLGLTRFEDLSIQMGSTMQQGLFDWIAKSWDAQPPRYDGAILRGDFNSREHTTTEFQGALISETTFPSFDAANKTAFFLELRLTPLSVAPEQKAPGTLMLPVFGAKQKLWALANFRLQIDGLDCSRVNRIDPFTVQRQAEPVIGQAGVPELQVGPVLFPDLRVTLESSSAESWIEWHHEFVISRKSGPTFEKSGSIQLLGPDLKTVLIRLDLEGLGIFRLASESPRGDSSLIAHHQAHLYCQRMTLTSPAL